MLLNSAGYDHPLLKNVSRETKEKLNIYISLLQQWNKKINLVSNHELDRVWERHVIDSLQLVDYIEPTVKTIADLGSGGGFPGLILALVTNVHITLIESDLRKSVFLREVLRQTQTHATVICQRIEQVNKITTDVITARALASLDQLLDFAKNKLNKNGYCLFLKGKLVQSEIEKAQKKWQINYEAMPSKTSADGIILRINQFEYVE